MLHAVCCLLFAGAACGWQLMLCAACYWLLHRVLHSPGTPAHHVLLTTAACKMFHTPTSATHNTRKVGKLLLVVVVLCCCRDGRLYLNCEGHDATTKSKQHTASAANDKPPQQTTSNKQHATNNISCRQYASHKKQLQQQECKQPTTKQKD